jgi:hypothetical protein
MARKVYRATRNGFEIGIFSTMTKAQKATGYTNKSGWVTGDLNPEGDRTWETYANTGCEIFEIVVR